MASDVSPVAMFDNINDNDDNVNEDDGSQWLISSS